MKRRVAAVFASIAGSALICSATACAGDFSLSGTRALEWDGHRLTSTYVVQGNARVETQPWAPCAGMVLPWAELRWGWETGGDGAQLAYAELHDPSGVERDIRCPNPPTITQNPTGTDAQALPGELLLAFGYDNTNCMRKPEADDIFTFPLTPGYAETPATPGMPAIEEVSFSKRIQQIAWPNWLSTTYNSYCLIQRGGGEVPNRQCAKFFDPDLCAPEYFSARDPLQGFRMYFIPTPTARCHSARVARNRIRARLRRHSSKLVRRFYLKYAQPRFIGECR